MARWRSCGEEIRKERKGVVTLMAFLFVLNSVHILLTYFIIVFNKNQSWYMNLKSSLKYHSYRRNFDLRATSRRSQMQTETKDMVHAENGQG